MNQVFISYRRENDSHNQRVRWLAGQLRDAGLKISFDEFYLSDQPGGPNEKWSRWCINQATQSACILVVGSPGWFTAFTNAAAADPESGMGAAAEANVIQEQLYQAKWVTGRHRIVILDPADEADLPVEISGWRRFKPRASSADLDDLIRWAASLTGDAYLPKPTRVLPAAPGKLHYLCDRDEQMGELQRFFAEARPESFRRPLMVVVHGNRGSAHSVFVDRLCEYELPAKLGTLGLAGSIERIQPPSRLTASDPAGLAKELREKITAEMQVSVRCDDDMQLLECFRKSRAAVFAPVFDFSSREAFAGDLCYVDMLRDYWSEFPDLPSGLAVICFLSIKYVETPPEGFFTKVFSRKKPDPLKELRKIISTIDSTDTGTGGVKVIHKVLDEFGMVFVEHVERWFDNPQVARNLRTRLQASAIESTIFKGQPSMPMERVLDELEPYISR